MKIQPTFSYLLIITLFIVSSCSKEAEVPEACLNGPQTGKVYELVTFTACSVANYQVLWTGDSLHNYDRRNEVFYSRDKPVFQTGWTMKDGVFQYRYSEPGEYKVVFIATNSSYDMVDYKKSIFETSIVIEE